MCLDIEQMLMVLILPILPLKYSNKRIETTANNRYEIRSPKLSVHLRLTKNVGADFMMIVGDCVIYRLNYI